MRTTAEVLQFFTVAMLVLAGCLSAPGQRPSSRPAATRATATPSTTSQAEAQSRSSTVPAPAPAHGPVVAPLSELTELDLGARVGPYPAQSAAWIRGQPVAVNHDFDFGIALAMEDGMGAGIAAAKRISKNAAFAEQLAKLEPIDPHTLLQRLCSDVPSACTKLAGARARIFGLLYGERAARLRVVLERVDATASDPIYVSISDALTLDDLARPGVLAGAFSRELGRILALIEAPSQATGAEGGRCAAGDSTTIAGHVIARDGPRVILAATDPLPARVSCAAGSFTGDAPTSAPARTP
jgi:hypothetical protein